MKTAATLHFLCGKLAAGKTTLAQNLAVKHSAILICEDIWLQRLFPDEISSFQDYLKYSERLKSVVEPLIRDLLVNGQSVVFDYAANTLKRRQWIRGIFESAQAEHLLHFVDTPNDNCIEQMHRRNLEKPEGSMEIKVEQLEHITSFFQSPALEEGFKILVYNHY